MEIILGERSPKKQLGQRGLRAEGSKVGPQPLGKRRLGVKEVGAAISPGGCPGPSV